MPGRFPLVAVPLTNDPFCEDGFCGDEPAPIPTGTLKCWYTRKADTPGGFARNEVYSSVVEANGDMYIASYVGSGVLPTVYKISNNVTQIWGRQYSLDPALVSGAFNDYGSTYFLLNSGPNTIDFLAWQWSPAGPSGDRGYPIRIYRYRISKADGAVINVAAVDFNPVGNPSELYIDITDVKIDANNNYYFMGTLPINNENITHCVFKFTQSFNYVWCRAIPARQYRQSTSVNFCRTTTQDGNLFRSLTVGDAGLIGCAGSNSFVNVFPNYFRLDFDGNTISSFLAKFRTFDFDNDTSPFIPRSVCRDAQGNIYGCGSYGSSGPVVVYKDSASDATIWAKDIQATFNPSRGSLLLDGNQLLVLGNKLILAAPWSGSLGGMLIGIFNTATGSLERSIAFNAAGGTGNSVIIQALPQPGYFMIQSDSGARIRLDVNNLPATGSYASTDDPTRVYYVSNELTTTADHTFYRFNNCGPSSPSLITRDLSGMFTAVTPVVTTSAAPAGTFRDFACQTGGGNGGYGPDNLPLGFSSISGTISLDGNTSFTWTVSFTSLNSSGSTCVFTPVTGAGSVSPGVNVTSLRITYGAPFTSSQCGTHPLTFLLTRVTRQNTTTTLYGGNTPLGAINVSVSAEFTATSGTALPWYEVWPA